MWINCKWINYRRSNWEEEDRRREYKIKNKNPKQKYGEMDIIKYHTCYRNIGHYLTLFGGNTGFYFLNFWVMIWGLPLNL